jgi:integrase/recombinase XerD
MAGLTLARSAAGVGDKTVRQDVGNLEQIRSWFGRPLWEMEPPDADAYEPAPQPPRDGAADPAR